ncbi:MAG: hypothetical protein ACK5LS_03490 [Propioniciclava sp.]
MASGKISIKLTISIAPEENAKATASQGRANSRRVMTNSPPIDVARPASSETSKA